MSHLQCGNNDVKNGAQSQASNPLGTWVCTCQVAFRAQCRVGNCGTRQWRPGDSASGSPCRFTVLLPNLEHNIREQSRINALTKTKYLLKSQIHRQIMRENFIMRSETFDPYSGLLLKICSFLRGRKVCLMHSRSAGARRCDPPPRHDLQAEAFRRQRIRIL